jgi:UBX domain-containing protein 7
MEEETLSQFVGITGSQPERAEQYLRITDYQLEQAIQLFFDQGGVDLEGPSRNTTTTQAPPVPSRPHHAPLGHQDSDGVVHLDSDEGDYGDMDDSDVEITGSRPTNNTAPVSSNNPGSSSIAQGGDPVMDPDEVLARQLQEDDEAMARRLQEELYAGGDSGGPLDANGVRAPIARTTETLVGPNYGGFGEESDDGMRDHILAQIAARRGRGRGM